MHTPVHHKSVFFSSFAAFVPVLQRLENILDEDTDAMSQQTNRLQNKNRRMSTNISAADLLIANQTSTDKLQVQVFMLDGSEMSFSITPKTKTRHALLIIKDLIQLENDADFGLFELRGGFAVGTYHLINDEVMLHDIIESWDKKAQDKKFLAVGDPGGRLGKNTICRHLVFKRRVYLPWSPLHREVEAADSVDSVAHHLEYVECIHHCMYSRYPLSKDRAVRVAALMLQQELGDWSASKYPRKGHLQSKVKELLPKYTLENRKLSKYEARCVKSWKDLSGYTPLDAQREVIEMCKFWFPWYGCEFFRVDYQRKLENGETRGHMLTGITVGVGHAGMHFLYRTHGAQKKVQPRMLLTSHKYGSLDKWITSKSGKVFSFYLGDDDICFIVSPQANHIQSLVRDYISEYMEVTKDLDIGADGELNLDEARKVSPSKRARKNELLDLTSTVPGPPDGDIRSKVAAAVTELAGGKEFVRIPYPKFKAYHKAVGFSESVESMAESITRIPGSAGSAAVPCLGLIEYILELPESLRDKCIESADLELEPEKEDDKKGEWEAVTDPNTGKPYYYHKKTRRSVWNLEDIAAQAVKEVDLEDSRKVEESSVWVEIEDSESGKPYYFNQVTGETSWTKGTSNNGSDNDGYEEADVVPHDANTSKNTRKSAAVSRRTSMAFAFSPEPQTNPGDGGKLEAVREVDEEDFENDNVDENVHEDAEYEVGQWAQMEDPATGDVYYVNNETGQSQWEMPAEAWVQNEHEGRVYWHNTITGE